MVANIKKIPAPDDHFSAGPHCRSVSPSRRVSRARGCPAIRARIVSPAGVHPGGAAGNSAPDDHFTSGPHGRDTVPGIGRVHAAGSRPTVRGRVVSPTSVE